MSDPAGTEYAAMATGEVRSAGLMSLASFLGVSLSKVIEMRDAGQLPGAIEKRNLEVRAVDGTEARRKLERRLAP